MFQNQVAQEQMTNSDLARFEQEGYQQKDLGTGQFKDCVQQSNPLQTFNIYARILFKSKCQQIMNQHFILVIAMDQYKDVKRIKIEYTPTLDLANKLEIFGLYEFKECQVDIVDQKCLKTIIQQNIEDQDQLFEEFPKFLDFQATQLSDIDQENFYDIIGVIEGPFYYNQKHDTIIQLNVRDKTKSFILTLDSVIYQGFQFKKEQVIVAKNVYYRYNKFFHNKKTIILFEENIPNHIVNAYRDWYRNYLKTEEQLQETRQQVNDVLISDASFAQRQITNDELNQMGKELQFSQNLKCPSIRIQLQAKFDDDQCEDLSYDSCRTCNKKLNGTVCPKCERNIEYPKKTYMISLQLQDRESKYLRVVGFGKTAYKFLQQRENLKGQNIQFDLKVYRTRWIIEKNSKFLVQQSVKKQLLDFKTNIDQGRKINKKISKNKTGLTRQRRQRGQREQRVRMNAINQNQT